MFNSGGIVVTANDLANLAGAIDERPSPYVINSFCQGESGSRVVEVSEREGREGLDSIVGVHYRPVVDVVVNAKTDSTPSCIWRAFGVGVK